MFKAYYDQQTGRAGYLFGSPRAGACAVVDAEERDVDAYLHFAGSMGMRITHVIDTHVRRARRSAGPALAARAGAQYCLHECADVPNAFTPVSHGRAIELGTMRVTILHTPGHTPESICVVVADLRDRDDPGFVLTGNTLLVGAVGSPQVGDVRASAEQLYDSLHERLLALPGEVAIFPGYVSRAGRGPTSRTAWSTIAVEKMRNPLLSQRKEAFVAALCAV